MTSVRSGLCRVLLPAGFVAACRDREVAEDFGADAGADFVVAGLTRRG
jgi:hypothetical protein